MRSSETEALVVVDVQIQFEEHSIVEKKVAEVVDQAIKLGQPIFVLEFVGFGSTASSVVRRVANYHRGYFIKKFRMDGSPRIKSLCSQLGIYPLMWKLCGIYTNSCVLATCKGLLERFPQSHLTVLKDAVSDSKPEVYSEDFSAFEELEQTVLI